MKFANRVAIPLDLSTNIYQGLKGIKEFNFINECHLHFVHVFPTMTYSYGIGEFPLTFPILEDRKGIEESVLAILDTASKEILGPHFKGKISLHCLFSENPKATFSDFLTSEKIDLVILATKKKHGVFESSFANYVNKHTEANVIMLKSEDV